MAAGGVAVTDVYTHAAGMVLMVTGVISSNEAVRKMARKVHLPFEVGCHSSTADRQSRAVIRRYRAKFGNGRLFLSFIAGVGIFGLGGMMFVFGK
jgi:alkanesulfonate monooxygenase SsuD/methylene tetrahydromethanopterin reductase-like flavin-dependent oxidoreductase (luciferase family)